MVVTSKTRFVNINGMYSFLTAVVKPHDPIKGIVQSSLLELIAMKQLTISKKK